MNKIVHYIGRDVHKDSIAVAINSAQVRRYGIIDGTLDSMDKLLHVSPPGLHQSWKGVLPKRRSADFPVRSNVRTDSFSRIYS